MDLECTYMEAQHN